MKTLIIEDELRAREHMIHLLLDNFPSVEVVGAVGSIKDSIAWLGAHEAPDVIFMDVELSDGSSFDIFTQIDVPSPVVMTTAYDQYAVQAFEVNALDYLLKPINLKDLQRAIARITSGEAVKPSNEVVRNLINQVRKEKFLIRLNDRIVPVRTTDIFRISRSCIISESVIDSVSKLMGGRLRISVRRDIPANTDFTVSRARVDDFLSWLEK